MMPDSPIPSSIVSDTVPSVSSPGQLHISTSTSQLLLDGRPPISAPSNALPNGYHAASPNQPLSPGMLNGMQLPPTCGVRQLSKLKRFLTTLQQFGSDISPDIGERVRGLIVNLVNNAISVEEFHQQLQEATNFPLRPFVIPFLKTNLPLLQQELLQCSQLSKRSPQPPHQFMGVEAHERERVKSENEDFGFEHIGTKRKSDFDRPKENGHHHSEHPGISPNKRKSPAGFDSDATAIVEHLMESVKQDADEWRNLETILQCVVSFVEKAKRSMAIIQERCLRDREEMTSWARAMAAETESEVKRRTAEQVSKTLKESDDRVHEVKRRAEEAVSDVKRQAVVELQKAVSAAEEKANDALSQVHQKMDQAVQDARRQAAEETSNLINQQENSKENCWNCGRKANETCSGCNVARYCGKFCQHKDWEQHQKSCGKQAKQHSSIETTQSPHEPIRTTSPARSNTPRIVPSGTMSPGPTVTSDNSGGSPTSVPVSVMQVSSASS